MVAPEPCTYVAVNRVMVHRQTYSPFAQPVLDKFNYFAFRQSFSPFLLAKGEKHFAI
jgi:hypothetical protein